jgi:carbon-monoxide dehydrogenase catalytic subunit
MEKVRSIDPAAAEILEKITDPGLSTAFDRVEDMKPCPIGASGSCCKHCWMGPCRITGKDIEGKTGICGANIHTIAARNFARAVAAGTAAHSDHGRDVTLALLAVSRGEAQGYEIKDVEKLKSVAALLGVETEGRTKEEIGEQVALRAIAEFGKQQGELIYLSRAPKKRQEIWNKLGIAPRGVDREVVETLNRTTLGVDQDPDHILTHTLRVALADGWGGSMLGTDITDVLFGTPNALLSKVNLGVLKEDEVNVVVHGHEPVLSELIVVVSRQKDLIDYAKSKGAKGINLAGICCTANEIMMRQGIPSAGNFLNQELAVLTGAVDAMIVDVQCIQQALVELAKHFHTKIITTSRKAKITGALHMEFDEHRALEIAREIVRVAIDNYPNRKSTMIPKVVNDLVAGFSTEYINYMLGGRYRASFRPLNDAIIQGRIFGAAGVVGCNNPRTCQDEAHNYIVKELIKNDVLVVQTGCGAIANAKYGLLTPEAMEYAGPGLREICEAVGIPPVLHLGSCVDNSRILTVLTEVVKEGGLGDDISDLPAVGIAPEWMTEKALAIGTYFVASGVYVLFGGVESPVGASSVVTDIITNRWEEMVGGSLEFEPDPVKIVEKTLEHIARKRKELKIDIKKERVLYDMEKRRELSV